MTPLYLGAEDLAFARGGNRLCFVDPRNSARCIKVDRLDRTPVIRRQGSRFPKKLRPLSSFDENREEFQVIRDIEQRCGPEALQMVPHCYGFVETNFGKGLVLELLRDADDRISVTLLQYVWEHGLTQSIKHALQVFIQQWTALGIPSRKLLLHNIIVQQLQDEKMRIVVIDGLGSPTLIPLGKWFKRIAIFQAGKKSRQVMDSIDLLLKRKKAGLTYGLHGWIAEEKRNTMINS